ncbi:MULTISPECIES: c-type cytochrome [Massilia]|uniref:c-type cytochrome n=1 Tax=Massilia TaxID=149698 RepID=UPI0025579397|nr:MULTISPECIES: c-type cytochrome [Massilia]MDK6077142.1 c-type cytochrome [Massilia varians]
MSMEKTFSFRNRWFTWSVAILAVIAFAAALVGFVWVPKAHARAAMESLWESICRAAGAPAPYQSAALPEDERKHPSNVIVNATMMGAAENVSVGRGATLAMACTMCHGARGTSPAGTPHLAGQPASSTYKQLRDFASGHRPSAIMRPLVMELSDQDMRDLSAYYASLERERIAAVEPVAQASPRLVRNGDPMRAIGACASCHSPHASRPATPVLEGLSESYLRDQLTAFRDGRRANDINRQMRNAAHGLTDTEIVELSRYYAAR